MDPSHFSSLASILLNSALRNSYIWCLHILSMGVWTFLWGVFDYNAMASRRRKSPPRPLPNPDLDHDTDSSLDRRQERWTKAMIQKIHKIQGDDSHCFASCPTLALSTKTYEAEVRSKNLPDEIVASVVFWSNLTLLAKQVDGVGDRKHSSALISAQALLDLLGAYKNGLKSHTKCLHC